MKRASAFLFIAVLISCRSTAFATPQVKDKLRYGYREYVIFQIPMLGLWHYGDEKPPTGKSSPPKLEVTSSANWAGYSATWEIRDKQLFLRTIQGRMRGHDVQNEAILPDLKFPAPATWFTGRIHLPIGDFSEETQEYESVILFDIEKGQVKAINFVPTEKINYTWNGN